ncbi:AarF/UbiB family protein [Mariniblastus sp.]|nr:AarF/UbiB family protein [Mariniblastus sp.]
MKRTIPSVPQLYRNVRRWTEIVSVLSKYGLADWLSQFNIDFLTNLLGASQGHSQSNLTQHQRIRMALADLGPTFIKFGQLLSTRPDAIGQPLADELSKLQSDTPSDDFETVKKVIENELGKPLEEVFVDFEETPIASASIGQVHLAKISADKFCCEPAAELSTVSGLIDVVVKVRHAGNQKTIETDLDIINGLAQLAERIEEFKAYQPVPVVNALSRSMRRELDFEREQRNLIQFADIFKKNDSIVIPRPFPDLCSSCMLTMERIKGDDLRVASKNCKDREQLAWVASSGADLYLQMIFNHGFYHADPHPGNILLTDDGKIGLLDFGMVGRISEQLREDIESMLVAIVNQDVSLLTSLIKRVGNCPPNLDDAALSNDIADFVGQYSTQNVSHFDMSGALKDFVAVVRQYKITLPTEASMLIKVLVSLEGTGRMLAPDFSLMEIMKPFQRMLLLKRMSPSRQIRKMRRFYLEFEQLVDVLPTRLTNILEQVQSGSFDVHLNHRRLGPSVNRMVVGLMTSALFLGSSLMLSYKVPPILFPTETMGSGGEIVRKFPWHGIQDLSALGLAGFIVSLLMGLRLMWAIRKSGNLDERL